MNEFLGRHNKRKLAIAKRVLFSEQRGILGQPNLSGEIADWECQRIYRRSINKNDQNHDVNRTLENDVFSYRRKSRSLQKAKEEENPHFAKIHSKKSHFSNNVSVKVMNEFLGRHNKRKLGIGLAIAKRVLFSEQEKSGATKQFL